MVDQPDPQHPAITAALRLVGGLDDLIGRGMAEQTAMAYVTADFLAMSVHVEDDQARGWLIGKACEFSVNRAALLRAAAAEIPDDISTLDP